MPNYCDCELIIKGKNAKELLSKIGNEDAAFDFNTIVPYPKEYTDKDAEAKKIMREVDAMDQKDRDAWFSKNEYPKDGFNSGGLQWCCDNWGTKWNACDVQIIEVSNNAVKLGFQTVWSPPSPIIMNMSQKFTEFKFTLKYWEGGSGFKGVYECKNGEELKDIQYNYRGPRGG